MGKNPQCEQAIGLYFSNAVGSLTCCLMKLVMPLKICNGSSDTKDKCTPETGYSFDSCVQA